MSLPSDEAEWADGPDQGALIDVDLPLVVIVDTGLVIDIKTRIPVSEQWDLLSKMMALVEAGRLAFPSKVHRELTEMKWPDAPGAWCGTAVKKLKHRDPDDATMAATLVYTHDLVEQDADNAHEKADPYVVAMAYALKTGKPPYDVAVATTDTVDRPPLKIAMTTACARLGITCWDFDTFVAWVRGVFEEPAAEDDLLDFS